MLNYEKRSPEYDFSLTFNRQKKLTELWPFFQKESENYTYGGVVRESPPCDFWIFLMINNETHPQNTIFHLLLTARKNIWHLK